MLSFVLVWTLVQAGNVLAARDVLQLPQKVSVTHHDHLHGMKDAGRPSHHGQGVQADLPEAPQHDCLAMCLDDASVYDLSAAPPLKLFKQDTAKFFASLESTLDIASYARGSFWPTAPPPRLYAGGDGRLVQLTARIRL